MSLGAYLREDICSVLQALSAANEAVMTRVIDAFTRAKTSSATPCRMNVHRTASSQEAIRRGRIVASERSDLAASPGIEESAVWLAGYHEGYQDALASVATACGIQPRAGNRISVTDEQGVREQVDGYLEAQQLYAPIQVSLGHDL